MNKKHIPLYAAAAIIAIVGIWLVVRASSSDNPPSANSNTETANINSEPQENSTTEPTPSVSPSPTNTSSMQDNQNISNKFVVIDVQGFGQIKIQLYAEDAPKTAENFVKLANSGFYNGLTFHRIAKGFVIQGGDPAGNGSGGPGYTIPAEIKRKHTKGAVAMARLGDQVNPNRESSGSQFYIALDELPMLDGQYTVFGQVVSGMDVAEKIAAVPINAGPFGGNDGAPQQPIIIKSATVSDK